ncbi:MAG TPA: hypothetical protein VFH99_02095 [Candidatus Saccharimonadales bacterium]|nr:hypothetical protein [Candidatus Saccharimonadales bacterium]
MSRSNPSDIYEIGMGRRHSPMEVGEARDFLDKPYAFLRPLRLLKIARGLSNLLHHEVDYENDNGQPLEHFLPEELERHAERGRQMVDEFAER